MELTPVCSGNVIGLDVHLEQVTATAIVVKPGGSASTTVMVFSALMAGLRDLAVWCQSLDPEVVVMESTGIYWVSVYRTLCQYGIKPMAVNARHVKNVKGRKTDTSDSLWLAMLARTGLLKPSFVPTPEFMDIRTHARNRQKVAVDLTGTKNRPDKVLAEAGIRIGAVVSDIHGVTARRMIGCLVSGGSAEEALNLAGRHIRRLKASRAELLLALEGDLSDLRRTTLAEIMDDIRFLEAKIAKLDQILLEALRPHQEALDLLQTIPGLGEIGAALILAETGPDMEEFGSSESISSWAGICPGSNESAGKRKSGRTRRGNRWIRRVLCEAAQAAVRTACSLKAKFEDLIRRRGYKRSIVAIGHKLLRIVCAILKNKEPYKDSTVDYDALRVKKDAPRWNKALEKYNLLKASRSEETKIGLAGAATVQSGNDQSEPKNEGSKKALIKPEERQSEIGQFKQKRGRPKKDAAKPEEREPENGPVKRKRGRPKKVMALQEVKAV